MPDLTSRERRIFCAFYLATAVCTVSWWVAVAQSPTVREATLGRTYRLEWLLIGDAISAHLRSLQADHLTDVLSSNQHTVKPWFNGRIDLAPPVIDLTAQGFTLIGGRLDYIDGKPAAAIVYRRRIHVINLFVAQDLGPAPSTPALSMMQGFNILRWNENGLNLLAVSDLNREELEEFGAKFTAAARAAPPG